MKNNNRTIKRAIIGLLILLIMQFASSQCSVELGSSTVSTSLTSSNPGDQTPIAEAGPDKIVKVGDTVSLDGSGSEDLEADPITYQWSFASKPVGSGAMLANSTSVDPYFTVDVTGDYEIQLIVSDGNSGSSADTLTIKATDGTISASRTSGVAPLAVFFNAGFVSSPVTGSGNSFHDVEYSWDFGDASGTWATNGLSRNEDKGPLAAHVYETAGTYMVKLTVKDNTGVIQTDTETITVDDPETFYGTANTVCISDISSNDFAGCDGTTQIATDSLSDIEDYIEENKRILLHRGSYWTHSSTGGIGYPMAGPITIGAYGDCSSPDDHGICANAPLINYAPAENGAVFNFSRASNVRIQDITFSSSSTYGYAISGNTDIERVLINRVKVTGYFIPISIGYWDTDGHDQVMVTNSSFSNGQAYNVWIGSERLAILGNTIKNPITSHVIRIFQAYQGIVAHNALSGSFTQHHTMKLYGPTEDMLADNGNLRLKNPTRFVVVSNNVIGGSGNWNLTIGPENAQLDERLLDILVEKNRFLSDYVDANSQDTQVNLNVFARDITIRNNIFDGTESSQYYTAIEIGQRGVEPAAKNVWVYNNTIYKPDSTGDTQECIAIRLDASVSEITARNNLVYFPNCDSTYEVVDLSSNLVADHNLLTDSPGLVDPENADPLLRDYSLSNSSPAISAGTEVPVYDDFQGTARPVIIYDLGAYEYN